MPFSGVRHCRVYAKCNAVVIAEIKLSKIAVQVLFRTVLIGPFMPRLKTEKKPSTVLVVRHASANIFRRRVLDDFVAAKCHWRDVIDWLSSVCSWVFSIDISFATIKLITVDYRA